MNPTYDLQTDNDLSKFLLGAIRDVRKTELDVDRAQAISQLADKYIKLKIAKCLEERLSKNKTLINIDSEFNKQLIQKA